jgi:hypothetical protein
MQCCLNYDDELFNNLNRVLMKHHRRQPLLRDQHRRRSPLQERLRPTLAARQDRTWTNAWCCCAVFRTSATTQPLFGTTKETTVPGTEAPKRGRKPGSKNLKTIERERLARLQIQDNDNESNEEKNICKDNFYFYFFFRTFLDHIIFIRFL